MGQQFTKEDTDNSMYMDHMKAALEYNLPACTASVPTV